MAMQMGLNAVRFADTALRNCGGFTVLLRVPGLAAAGSDAEQLGLASPTFQDEPIGPAVWRRTGQTKSLLLAASAVAPLMGSRDFASAESMFESAAGVVVDEVFYTISASEPLDFGGVPWGYGLTLVAPARQ